MKWADSIWTVSMNQHLNESETEVAVRLGKATISVGDLMTLETGDIIPLDKEVSGEVSLEIEGVDKMNCILGVHKGSKCRSNNKSKERKLRT